MGAAEKLKLPEADREFLEEKYPDYDVLAAGGELNVILPNFPFPEVYAPRTADLLIVIPAGYPNAPLDMFWTYPDVKLAANNGMPRNCEHHENKHDKLWQRWSRHFFNEKPWRIGVDNLRTFMTTVKSEIAKGI